MGPVARGSVAKRACGYARHMFGRWRKKKEQHRAEKQQGDPDALEREGDPRGGLQDSSYRTAEATDVVEAEGVAMSGPGGAPQEATSPDERREQDR
jgi:hypothetical protein